MPFQLSPPQAEFLLSARGNNWLRRAANLPLTPATQLNDVQTLRRDLSPAEASAVMEQVLLRRRGAQKFERAAEMFFVRSALEQATHYLVAQHRAKRFDGAGWVADLGCGIGGDALALAQAAGRVIGLDANALRLALAQRNAGVYGLTNRLDFTLGDALRPPFPLKSLDAFFADPARRARNGKRTFDPQQYSPPLSALLKVYGRYPLGVKVAPGVDYAAISVEEVEVVSLNGEVKETVLWFNALATPGVTRRATLLPQGISLTDAAPDDCSVKALGDYLYEPDPAIIRAGLVKQAGTQLGLWPVDEKIAYLSGNAARQSPLMTGYQIEARLPLKMKQINRYLKNQHIARVNVKQRGTGLKPKSVLAQLKPAKEGVERTLILLRMQEKHLALVCQRVTSNE
jgi:SAM-dependent methyltransferase